MSLLAVLAALVSTPMTGDTEWPGGRQMEDSFIVSKDPSTGSADIEIVSTRSFERRGDVPRSGSTNEPRLKLDPGARVSFKGRFFEVLGDKEAKITWTARDGSTITAPASKGERHDWLTYVRRSIDEIIDTPLPSGAKPVVKEGSLLIVGGGGLTKEMTDRFIEDAGGSEAKIVYIPCSYEKVIDEEPGFVRFLRRAGAENVTWVHTKDRIVADTEKELLDKLRTADGLWFGGGRQWNFVDSYQGTRAEQLMHDVLKRGGVIGGSSAGASIQAEVLARGNPLGNAEVVWPGYTRGFGFLPGAMIDQHYSERGRAKQMPELLDAFPETLGIGIDETTAIYVRGSTAEVIGRGSVFFYDRLTGNTQEHEIKSGRKFDLMSRKPSTLGTDLLLKRILVH